MLAKIQKLFPDFIISQSEIDGEACYHGIINVSNETKLIDKDRIKYGNVTLYISSTLYKGTEKSFLYGMIEQTALFTPYRKKIGQEIKVNKIFESSKSLNKLITNLAKKNDLSLFEINSL